MPPIASDPVNKCHIVIDARSLLRGSGGIRTYLREILKNLAGSREFDITLYTDGDLPEELQIDFSAFHVRVIPRIFQLPMSWFLFSQLWLLVDRPQVFWSPRHHLPFYVPRPVSCVVTIHDLVWKTSAFSMPKIKWLSERLLMPKAVKRADALICVSETTRNVLLRHFQYSKNKTYVIKHGVSSEKVERVSRNRTVGSEAPYFLAVGTLEPRKNYERLIAAFDCYREKGGKFELVIVGKRGWRYAPIFAALEDCSFQKSISILPDVTDLDLESFYRAAAGFISPSLDEGYGLPAQEAIHFGLPILLSRIAVYQELYPNSDLWIDPESTDDMTAKISEFERLILSGRLSEIATDEVSAIKEADSWAATAALHEKVFTLQTQQK